METTINQRVKEVIGLAGYKSTLSFANDTKIPSSTLRDVVNGTTPNIITITKILLAVPTIEPQWLLTGEGQKFRGENVVNSVPLLPISAQGGALTEFTLAVMNNDCERVISPVKGAELAITVNGDSMIPEYPNGSQVFVKKVDARIFIEWGKVYVLDTLNGAILKKIMPSDKDGYIKCVSLNSEYPAFEVALSDVNGIYRVLLSMSVK